MDHPEPRPDVSGPDSSGPDSSGPDSSGPGAPPVLAWPGPSNATTGVRSTLSLPDNKPGIILPDILNIIP